MNLLRNRILPLSVSVLISLLVQAQGLKTTSGGYIIVNSGYVRLSENLINNGTYRDNNGTLIFSGTTQSVSGANATTLNNLKISTGSTTTLSTAGQTLKGILTSDGTLAAGNNITLLSTSGQTALVSGAGAGSVTGNLTMQRYLASGFGYKYFCSPFQAAPVSEFADDVDLAAAFPTFYSYGENHDTTWWFNYTTGTNVLAPMLGYAVNFGASADPKTVDVTGVVSNGNMSVTLYNHNKAHTKGFTLVGNPYPSPIDWDASSGWTRTNVDNAVYYFNSGSANQYVGSYSTYINGVSSDGIANNLIPAMQGFFVHVTNGTYPVTGTLGFSNAIRINTLNPVFHKSGLKEDDILLRIAAGFDDANGFADPMVIRFNEDALREFNVQQDAVKLMNTNPKVPSFYIVSDDSRRYAIKALPVPEDSLTIIPVGIKTLQDGLVDFSVVTLEQQNFWRRFYLSDDKYKSVTALNTDATYQVFLEKGVYDDRFSIIMSMKEIQTSSGSETGLVSYYHGGKVYVYLDLLNGEHADLQITDMLGRIIHREHVSGIIGLHAMSINVQSGVYIISLRSDRLVASKKILIRE